MEKKSKDFMDKIRFNTYIYTFTFMLVAIGYSIKHSRGVEPFMLLLASFAFYAVGRQINLVSDLENGAELDKQPKAPVWVRGITYLVVLLMVFSLIFS